MDRVIWIADAGYLIKACPDNFDYLKLKAVLEKECAASISESFYLNSTPDPPSDGQNSFHSRRWDVLYYLYGSNEVKCVVQEDGKSGIEYFGANCTPDSGANCKGNRGRCFL